MFYNDPIRVEVPGHGMIEFPPGTPPQVIRAAIDRLTGGPDTGAPAGAATGALQARQDAMDPVLRDQKRQELETIRREGDLGFTDVEGAPDHGFWSIGHRREQQGAREQYMMDTIADRGFGWVVGGAERIGVLPEGTRAALRENQEEAKDRYLLANPEGGLGRAVALAGGDVVASMTGPQALLGPGTGALASRGLLAAGASPGAARLAGFAGGAMEGAAQAYLDSPDLSPQERWKSIALSAGLGGFGSTRAVRLPEDDLALAARRAPAAPDVTQPRPRPQLSEAELAMYQQERAAVPEIVAQQVAAREGMPGRAPLTPEDIQAYQGALERQVDQKWAARLAEVAAQEDSPAVRIAADDLAVKLAPEVKAPPRIPVKEVQAFGETWQIDLNPAESGHIGPFGKPPGGPATATTGVPGAAQHWLSTGSGYDAYQDLLNASNAWNLTVARQFGNDPAHGAKAARLRSAMNALFADTQAKWKSSGFQNKRPEPDAALLQEAADAWQDLHDYGVGAKGPSVLHQWVTPQGGAYANQQIAQVAVPFQRVQARMMNIPGSVVAPAAPMTVSAATAGSPRPSRSPTNVAAAHRPIAPPPRPSDSVIAHDITETTAPFRERLREQYDRFVEQFSDKEVGPGRMLRRQGLGAEGEKIDKLIAHNRAAVAAADLPLFQGVESFDPVTGNKTRVYDPLAAIIGGMDDPSVRDLNDLMAAEHHMELLARQERAALEYDMARARRLEEMRQARQADRQSLRAMSGDIRDQIAQRIRAERAEAKATGRYDAYLKSEGRAGRAGSRRGLLTPMEQSTDAAAGALGRGQQGLAAAPDPRRAVASAQRVAMGIRDEATSWSRRFPRVERPADLDLSIDPAGTQAAQAILQDLQGRYGADPTGRVAQLADIADRVREWSYHAVVRPLRETGFLSEGQVQALMGKNERYAPFFRIMDEVDADGSLEVLSGSTNAKPIRRISGGLSPERPIAPPLESFIQQAQKVTVWARRQQIRNMLGDLAEVHPDTVGAEVKKIRGTGGADSFPVYRDGVATHYQAPADVILALQRLTPKQANIVTEAAQAAARLLRAGATLSPEFAARNLWRDQWSAAVYGSKYGYVPFVDAVHGLFEVFRKGDAYRGYLSGGAMSDMVSYQRQAIQRTLADVRGQGGGWGRFRREWGAETNRVAKVLFPVLYPLEAVSKTIEMSTRVGAYRKAKIRGASDLDAAVYSRDITLDFGRSGTFGQRWNGVEAFANASLQDVARFRQAMQNPKTAFSTSVKALAWITVPAALNYLANRPDDEVAAQYRLAQQALDAGIEDQLPEDQRVAALLEAHPELRYQDLPEWEKRAFYHVGWKADGRPWRIPRPLGLLNLFFGYGVEKTLDAIMQTDPDAGEDIRNAIAHETPLRFLNPLEAAPSLMQPGVEAIANYSAFKQGPIVPASQEKLLPEDQQTDQTSGIARWAGRQTGTSPLKIDYLIRGYLGTLGGAGARTGSAGLDVASKVADYFVPGASAAVGWTPSQLPPLPTQAQDVPLVKGFVGTSAIGFGSQPVSDMYTVARVAEQANESFEKAMDNGDAVNAARIMREHPELMVLDPLREGLKELRELRKMREEVRHDASLTPQARLEALMQIDHLVTQIAGARMIGVAEELAGQGLKLRVP